jgi:antitoxin component YwqK of YwqJK toxin-antitoxin module
MLLKVWFKDKQLTIYDGPYTLYFGKGIKAVEGYYKDSRRIGIWKYYYPNGAIKDSGEINGKWKSWYPSGILESEGEYSNDLMAGSWTWYRDNGKPSTIEEYKNGKIAKLQCFDEQGNYSGEFCSILKPPYPLGEFRDFQSHMLDNISMPKDLQKKELKGVILVTCDITKEGKLSKVIVETPYEQLTKEVERFFNTLTNWSPAITHNRAIDYKIEYKIPLNN